MGRCKDTAAGDVSRLVRGSILHHQLADDAVASGVSRGNSTLVSLATRGIDGTLSRKLDSTLAIASTIEPAISAG